MKILILGDIYGHDGVMGVASYLPFMIKEMSPDIVIANAENASEGGKSLTKKDYDFLSAAGVQYFTMGNHTFKNDNILTYIDEVDNMVRPANLKDVIPGKGYIIFNNNEKRILLINLLGNIFISNPTTNMFKAADDILEENEGKYDLVIVDVHAEATAEKIVLANYLSKKGIGIVVGTHTHIQTADERILNNTTAYISDIGMCGVFDSAIGANFEEVEGKMRGIKGKNTPFKEAKGKIRINAVLITLYDNSLKPYNIERIIINP